MKDSTRSSSGNSSNSAIPARKSTVGSTEVKTGASRERTISSLSLISNLTESMNSCSNSDNENSFSKLITICARLFLETAPLVVLSRDFCCDEITRLVFDKFIWAINVIDKRKKHKGR
jgi:hypothetical protein